MRKSRLAGIALLGLELLRAPLSLHESEATLRIFFPDVGHGHAALILSPTGRALLIDGGPDGAGATVLVPLMRRLGLTRLDGMIATHYDADHIGGLDEVAAAFPPAVAYDSGDLTAPRESSSFMDYLKAIGPSRRTLRAGESMDLGGGVRVTCLVVNGDLLSGGRVGIFGRFDPYDQVDNSASIGLLIQYDDFDLFLSGDLTGGGDNTTDVESTVAQLVGDVDMVQLNHHGSATSGNATFLSALRAEVGIVQVATANSYGHPSVEVVDRFITTTPTSGLTPDPPDGNIPPSRPPFLIQTQASPPSDPRVSRQGLVAEGTIEIETNGRQYTVRGGRLPPMTFPTDGAERGVRTDFPPTILAWTSPSVPSAGEAVLLSAQIADDSRHLRSARLTVSVNDGEPIALPLTRLSETLFIGEIPGYADGTRVRYCVTAEDGAGQGTTTCGIYFSGITPIRALRAVDAWGLPRFEGALARIRGIVTVGSGTFSRSQTEVFVEDETGGIRIFELRAQSRLVSLGDHVLVTGRVKSSQGTLELDITNPLPVPPFPSPFGIRVLSRSEEAPRPRPVRLRDIGEALEGQLVRIEGVRILQGAIPPSGSANLRITDGTGTTTLRIVGTTDIPGLPTPTGSFTLIGVVAQFDSFRPFTRGYQILPRRRADLLLPLPASHGFSREPLIPRVVLPRGYLRETPAP
jgi:beta-lactamase superfamily II metal-dependent hydrolase